MILCVAGPGVVRLVSVLHVNLDVPAEFPAVVPDSAPVGMAVVVVLQEVSDPW